MNLGNWRGLTVQVNSETLYSEDPCIDVWVTDFDGEKPVTRTELLRDVSFKWFPGDKRDTPEEFANQAFGAAIVAMHNRENVEQYKASLKAASERIPPQRL